MTLVSTVLLRLAVALLPTTHQARFLDEWGAELEATHREANAREGVRYAGQLVAAAPMYTLPSGALAWACYRILSRQQLFDGPKILGF